MYNNKEKYISIVCQNEVYFQNLFNKILFNLNGFKNTINYHILTFDYAVKYVFDYVVYLDANEYFNINKLRLYLKENNSLTLVNVDSGDIEAFNIFDNIITFGIDNTSMFQINNISINQNLFVFNIYINGQTFEMYHICTEEYELYYLLAVIIILLNEGFSYFDIKQSIQQINKPLKN